MSLFLINNNPAKYIDIESNTNEKLDNFLIELQNIDLNTKLNLNPFSNLSKNYDTLKHFNQHRTKSIAQNKGL